jgi:hypothetical protein
VCAHRRTRKTHEEEEKERTSEKEIAYQSSNALDLFECYLIINGLGDAKEIHHARSSVC